MIHEIHQHALTTPHRTVQIHTTDTAGCVCSRQSTGWQSTGWQSTGWQSTVWQSTGWQSSGWQSTGCVHRWRLGDSTDRWVRSLRRVGHSPRPRSVTQRAALVEPLELADDGRLYRVCAESA